MSEPPAAMSGWPVVVAAYLTHLRAAGRSAGTLRLRRHYLDHLAEHLPAGPWTATPDDLAAYLSRPGWKPETRKSARAAVRGFYSWAVDTERIRTDPARRLPPVRIPAGVPRPAPEDVIAAALTRAIPRDRLMLLLAASAGLRCAEVARVHTSDLLGGALRVHGKGGVVRSVPLQPTLVAEIAALPAGYVFPGQVDGHMSAGNVSKVLKRLLGAGWTGHTLRHRYASRAYAGTRDLRAVQTLLGHSKPETTARYTLVPEDHLLAAARAAMLAG